MLRKNTYLPGWRRASSSTSRWGFRRLTVGQTFKLLRYVSVLGSVPVWSLGDVGHSEKDPSASSGEVGIATGPDGRDRKGYAIGVCQDESDTIVSSVLRRLTVSGSKPYTNAPHRRIKCGRTISGSQR